MMQKTHNKSTQMPVAVIGMYGRFPDAYDPAEFWSNLINGHDAFQPIPEKRWSWQDYFGTVNEDEMLCSVNCAAFMPDIDKFDHRHFGIMPREAESMDPQQRLFMQTAYHALEDAGIAPSSLSGSMTGVFVGVGNAEYHTMMVRDNARFDLFRGTGLALTSIANRVSFHLDIHGPSETLDTACSGSLVAIHRAIQSMSIGECEYAIVGGVNLLIGPDLFVAFDKAGMLSHDARSKTFDADANGYARGEGVAALVLCPLETAEKNGEHIYAVIHGSAENHGGRAHSFTAPNAKSQAEVVKRAWQNSGQNFLDATCIETHGTGTPLGDPIEVNGLKRVADYFSDNDVSAQHETIALGALKSHIGHMEATAGVGGVIKMILSFKHKTLPGNLHFKQLNPHIDLNKSPFYISTSNTSLDLNEHENFLAGISSFGFGGVNAHVVIGSYENEYEKINTEIKQPYLIVLSARDKDSLLARVVQMHDYLISENSPIEDTILSILNNVCSKKTISLEDPLHTLLETHYQLYQLQTKIDSAFSLTLEPEEIAGCYSVQEFIHHISHLYNLKQRCKQKDADFIQSQVCLPQTEQEQVTLAQIAYGLQNGRDYFKHRLACVVDSKEQLIEQFKRYIKSQDEQQDFLWTNVISHKSITVEKPNVDLNQRPDTEELSLLAHWWLHDQTAVLTWETIYQDEKRPNKTPLPATPFRRKRIWYSAGITTKDTPNEINTSINVHNESVHQAKQIEKKSSDTLDRDMFTAWQEIQKNSQIHLPSSILTTGLILDYAIHKSSSSITQLNNIVFTKPENIDDELRFLEHKENSSNNNKISTVYCLSPDKKNAVMVRSDLVNDSKSKPQASKQIETQQTKLTTQEYINYLNHNLHLSLPLDQWIKEVKIYDSALLCQINIGHWQERSSHFWVPLLYCLSTSFAYLCTEKNEPFVFLSEIKNCFIEKTNAVNIQSYFIQYDASNLSFSVDFRDKQEQSCMFWSGVKLRRYAYQSKEAKSIKTDIAHESERVAS